MKKYLALLLIAVTGVAFANVEKVPSSPDKGVEAIEPAFHNMPKHEGKLPLSYVNQPPMIPHSIKGYQVTKNTNQCLNCHGVENYRTTGAPRISPTHFMDRNGNVTGDTSPRRYFCLQCHVPQANVDPIIENQFEPTKAFGGK
ncbi:nitrate reductase cytochrome c-type subunit [Glaesserella parasuis]|uniref:nitrate reductase cytochrome c-type subunit n=1 Tax=Glaesserella parasuis TaxID=738 RepID=UPI00243652A0|nr:nitrate reductase cytochrome c-type subunit [Glaesserella parasuis]MDG6457036.1 nitrate reductase cytochrome c-type subunit [Glaesserella parasuis]MDG6789462.1 nitrate reductase cytochrome c-type subunit [Glaesserella parasuis]MDG6807177.1 nitrate reductase cytochrome c-type subunit [Glaesserella parasuis]